MVGFEVVGDYVGHPWNVLKSVLIVKQTQRRVRRVLDKGKVPQGTDIDHGKETGMDDSHFLISDCEIVLKFFGEKVSWK